jgi:cytochrome c-type biogenesis protein CcmF
LSVELGHLALILAFLVATVQAVVPMIGAQRGWSDWMRLAVPAATVQFLLTAAAFAVLMHAFAVSDFSVQLVAQNSNSAQPLIYKLAATWGNHEGSMLLWMLILTLFGAMVAWWGVNLPPGLKARVLAVQSTIAVAFFGFVLLTSSPFLRLADPPIDGQDLNPLLQDPGLASQPP